MQLLWGVIGLAFGGFAVFLFLRQRFKAAENKNAEDRNHAEELIHSNHKLDLELASLREIAGQVSKLSMQAETDRSTILDLTQKHSTAAASLASREDLVGGLKNQIMGLEKELVDARSKLNETDISRAELQATISEREIALKEERAQFTAIKDALKAQFAQLSAEALKNNGETFLATAKHVLDRQCQSAEGDLKTRQEEIKNLVKPIQDGINAVREAANAMETTRATAFGTIEQQLKSSVASAAEVARQTSALKDALKRPNVRGRWGEVQLKICVELAGMEEHCDVEFQETSLSPEDEALRPDMVVRMPGGKKITVDSKTPMAHFLSYIEATTDEERQLALASHAKAARKHVGDLAKTNYMEKIAGSPDFVVMFLPNESFLSMALEREPSLMEDALKKKVLIATPGTLVGLLKVVQYGWNEQKAAQNAQLIVEEGVKLNSEIVRFLEDFADLGLALNAVNEAFGNSRRRVENQIAKRSLNLTVLKAKSTALPVKGKKLRGEVANILRAAGADDEDIEQTEGVESLALAALVESEENNGQNLFP